MVISTIGKTTRPDNLPEETQDKVRCALYQVVGVNVDKVAPEHLIFNNDFKAINRNAIYRMDANENKCKDRNCESEDDESLATLCSGLRLGQA